MRSPHVLIVEDDESLGLALVDAFERDGYRVDHVVDGREALERGLARRFDLIVLDLMLPGMDGYEVCKRLRAAGRDSPILMLTARGREEDRVHGLDLGADDYLCKPFSLRELLARARARVRAKKPIAPQRVAFDGIEIDLGARVVREGNRVAQLTPLETGMLSILLAHRAEVVTRHRFLDEVWGYDRHPTTRTIDMHMARLRAKLGADDVIATVHGVGYRFDPPESFEVRDIDVA